VSVAEKNTEEKPRRKQQQRSLKTQQKLLGAAIEAFSENGFKGTSTRDIAVRAGVHHPLITYHFKNKEELWRAAADRIFSEFKVSMNQALQESINECPRTRMASLIRTYVHYAASRPAMHKVMVQDPQGDVAILFNMIRVAAGGLVALGHELKGTSGIDLNAPGKIDELADMIVDVFLPLSANEQSGTGKEPAPEV
jgi:AcrR family transcriptional regulator